MPAPSRRPPMRAEVLETLGVTPHVVRVVLGGSDLEGFGAGAFTDHYVKLHLPPPGASYAEPFDMEDVRARLPRAEWPRTRTYTVRAWEPGSARLTIDFVVHGDDGVAGPWAAAARPGDLVQLSGPGGAYAPDPDADWHLMVGDESVIPAISASLARVPAGVPVHVVLELSDPADEQPLATAGDLSVTVVHRSGADAGDELLAETLRAMELPGGRVHAFVHGEASSVRAVRRHLVAERGVPPSALSVSGYWKRRRTEEGWREEKADWARQVEQDDAAAGVAG